MENFLVQTFTISNHPIKDLKEVFKLQYIMGLGEFLCYITQNSQVTKKVFEIWCNSILGRTPESAWSYTNNFKAIKKGLAIHRDGFSFFTMRLPFFFDCFYLLEKSQKNLHSDTYTFFEEKICGFFSKKAFNYTYDYFKGTNNGEKLPDALKQHREISQTFVNKKIKRILIVATMSAGKSTLVNALVGKGIRQVRSTACTNKIHYIYNKSAKEGAMTFSDDKRLFYTNDHSLLLSESIHSIGINFASSLSEQRICLIDTPGVNYNGDKSHRELTLKAIRENKYDTLLLVMNAQQLAINDEKDLIEYIGKYCKQKIVGVLNQCDAFKTSRDSISVALETCQQMMHENNIKPSIIIPISAYTAYLCRQASELGEHMDEEEAFELQLILKKMSKPYYNLPSYIPGIPKDIKIDSVLERSGIPYLEYLILSV